MVAFREANDGADKMESDLKMRRLDQAGEDGLNLGLIASPALYRLSQPKHYISNYVFPSLQMFVLIYSVLIPHKTQNFRNNVFQFDVV